MMRKLLIVILLLGAASAATGDDVEVPARCRWTNRDCQRLAKHSDFVKNCDKYDYRYNYRAYSCALQCAKSGGSSWCRNDYCKGRCC